MLTIDVTPNNFIDFLIINSKSSEQARSFMWTEEECKKIIESSESLTEQTGTVSGEKIDLEMRKVVKYQIPNNDQFSWIYDKITRTVINANTFFWNYDIDFIETVELLKYSFDPDEKINCHYNKHSDFGQRMTKRKLSYTALLSDPQEYHGGDLTFYLEKDIVMPKEQGQVILFPSFQFHSISEITQGTRWSLVTWVSGRPFR